MRERDRRRFDRDDDIGKYNKNIADPGEEESEDPAEYSDLSAEASGDSYSRDEQRRRLLMRTAETEKKINDPTFRLREAEQKRDRMRDALAIFSLVAALFAGAMFYAHNYGYTTYSITEEAQIGALSGAQMYSFGNGVLVVGGDTVTCIVDGTVVSTSTVSLQDPFVAIEGDYYAVCDRNGYQVCIGDSEGIISTVRVSRKIRGIDVSASGVLAVFTESNDAAYISYFDRYGSRLSVEVKTVLDASGFPMRIAVSPDGQKLLVIYYSTQNGIGESRLVLYDFEHGKADSNYAVFSMEDFHEKNTLLVDGDFFDDEHFVAIGDNEAVFVRYDHVNGASEPVHVGLSDTVKAVTLEAGLFGVLMETRTADEFVLYDKTGEELSRYELEAGCDTVHTNGRYVFFINDKALSFYNVSGLKRYEGELVSAPTDAVFAGRHSLLLSNGSVIERIDLK